MQVTFDIENYLNSIHEQPFKAKKLQRIYSLKLYYIILI